MNKLIIVLMILFITCCWFLWDYTVSYKGDPYHMIDTLEEQYIIARIDPPTHFYLDLKRISDSVLVENIYVSKHCSGFKLDSLEVGDTITATRYRYYFRDSARGLLTEYDLYERLCH